MADDGRRKMGKVIAQAWADEKYRQRLHSHPHETLAEAGIPVPEGHKVHVLEDTGDTWHFVIPRRPSHLKTEDLSNDQVHADVCKISC